MAAGAEMESFRSRESLFPLPLDCWPNFGEQRIQFRTRSAPLRAFPPEKTLRRFRRARVQLNQIFFGITSSSEGEAKSERVRSAAHSEMDVIRPRRARLLCSSSANNEQFKAITSSRLYSGVHQLAASFSSTRAHTSGAQFMDSVYSASPLRSAGSLVVSATVIAVRRLYSNKYLISH